MRMVKRVIPVVYHLRWSRPAPSLLCLCWSCPAPRPLCLQRSRQASLSHLLYLLLSVPQPCSAVFLQSLGFFPAWICLRSSGLQLPLGKKIPWLRLQPPSQSLHLGSLTSRLHLGSSLPRLYLGPSSLWLHWALPCSDDVPSPASSLHPFSSVGHRLQSAPRPAPP